MKNSGVSEILGGLLAIAIVFGGIGIIGVYLISTPPPEAYPQVSFLVYCCDNTGSYSVLIAHQGGDAIRWSDIAFKIDSGSGGEDVSPSCSYTGDVDSSPSITTGKAWYGTSPTESFKTGDTLKIIRNNPNPPERLLIIKSARTNQVLLDTEFTCFKC